VISKKNVQEEEEDVAPPPPKEIKEVAKQNNQGKQ